MFQAVEAKIIERLAAGMPDGVRILQHAELDEATDSRQWAPFVAVVYDGYSPGEAIAPTGQIQRITQEWYVVVAAKSAKRNGKDIAARDAAGDLADTVLQLLLGYHLGGGQYLRLRESPGPEYQDGYCYLPIGFTSAATFKGIP